MKLSNYAPTTHDARTYALAPVEYITRLKAVQYLGQCDPVPRTDEIRDQYVAPRDTEAGSLLILVGGDEVDPDDDRHARCDELWTRDV